MHTVRRSIALLVTLATALVAAPASAEEAAPAAGASASSAFHVDAEIDPTAYLLKGYSLHLGLGWRRVRLDLGAYAMALPAFAHADDGFDVSFDGFGAKLQYFLFSEQKGLFAGVDAGLARVLAERQGTDLAVRRDQVSVGVNAGWRIPIVAGLYATPWIGIGWSPNARDVTLGGAKYEASPVTVFPAVHLGYRFQ